MTADWTTCRVVRDRGGDLWGRGAADPRGDAERKGWRVSEIGDGYHDAGKSSDPKRRDECPRCRTDRPAPDTKPDGALPVITVVAESLGGAA